MARNFRVSDNKKGAVVGYKVVSDYGNVVELENISDVIDGISRRLNDERENAEKGKPTILSDNDSLRYYKVDKQLNIKVFAGAKVGFKFTKNFEDEFEDIKWALPSIESEFEGMTTQNKLDLKNYKEIRQKVRGEWSSIKSLLKAEYKEPPLGRPNTHDRKESFRKQCELIRRCQLESEKGPNADFTFLKNHTKEGVNLKNITSQFRNYIRGRDDLNKAHNKILDSSGYLTGLYKNNGDNNNGKEPNKPLIAMGFISTRDYKHYERVQDMVKDVGVDILTDGGTGLLDVIKPFMKHLGTTKYSKAMIEQEFQSLVNGFKATGDTMLDTEISTAIKRNAGYISKAITAKLAEGEDLGLSKKDKEDLANAGIALDIVASTVIAGMTGSLVPFLIGSAVSVLIGAGTYAIQNYWSKENGIEALSSLITKANDPRLIRDQKGVTYHIMEQIAPDRNSEIKGQIGNGFYNATADSKVKNTIIGNKYSNRINIVDGDNNYVDGKAGRDIILGSDKRDKLVGGEGVDALVGNQGDDILIGGTLEGVDNNQDVYVFEVKHGNDTIIDNCVTENHELDQILLMKGVNITGFKRIMFDLIITTNKVNTIEIKDYFAGKASRNDTKIGRDFLINGKKLSEIIIKNEAFKTLHGTDGGDEIEVTKRRIEYLNIEKTNGNQLFKLDSTKGYTVYGGIGEDTIKGSSKNDTLYGGADNDTLIGDSGKDILYGGTENDTLKGGVNGDTYHYKKGDGFDTIDDVGMANKANVSDVLVLDGYSKDQVLFKKNGINLEIISLTEQNRRIISIKNHFNKSARVQQKIEKIIFRNGDKDITVEEKNLDVLTQTGLKNTTEKSDWLYVRDELFNIDAKGGNDHIVVNRGLNEPSSSDPSAKMVLNPLVSPQILNGGSGNDTYEIQGKVFGKINIDERQNNTSERVLDKLIFTDYAKKELTFSKLDNDLIIISDKGKNRITINDYFESANTVKEIVFSTGEVLRKAAIDPFLVDYKDIEIDDVFDGDGKGNVFDGGAGNDTLKGNGGADTLNGGADDDKLYGGKDNDTLIGGSGANAYFYNKGDGRDTIVTGFDDKSRLSQYKWSWKAKQDWNGRKWTDGGGDAFNNFGNLILRSKNGGIAGVEAPLNGVRLDSVGVFKYKTESRFLADNILEIIVSPQDEQNKEKYSLEFGGTLGSQGKESITTGKITLKGKEYSYVQSVDDTKADPNIFMLIIPEQKEKAVVEYTQPSGNLYGKGTNLNGKTRVILIPHKEKIGDLVSLLEKSLYQAIKIAEPSNILNLGQGIKPSDIDIHRVGQDIILKTDNAGNEIVLKDWHKGNRIDKVVFDDGTVWSKKLIHTKAFKVVGTDEKDVISGLNTGDNELIGNGGNDTLHGGKFGNKIDGGEGDDTITCKRARSLWITPTKGTNRMLGGAGNDTFDLQNTNDDYIFAGSGDDTISLYYGGNTKVYGEKGNDNIKMYAILGSDGKVFGGEGNDVIEVDNSNRHSLYGGNGDDKLYLKRTSGVINGGEGNDTLSLWHEDGTMIGGSGNDTYLYNMLAAKVVISQNGNLKTDDDNIEIGVFSDIENYLKKGEDLILTGEYSKLTVEDYFSSKNTIREIRRSGKKTLDYNGIVSSIDDIHGSTEGETLEGNQKNNIIKGFNGIDTINGLGGNDTLDGGEGNDTLNGGAGNDILIGGAGENTYIHSKGEGKDTVNLKYSSGLMKDYNWTWNARKDWNGVSWSDGGSDAFDGFGNLKLTIDGNTHSNVLAPLNETKTRPLGKSVIKSSSRFISNNILEITVESLTSGSTFDLKFGGDLGSDGAEKMSIGNVNIEGKQFTYAQSVDLRKSDANVFMLIIPDGAGTVNYNQPPGNLYGEGKGLSGKVRILVIPHKEKVTDIVSFLEGAYGSQVESKSVLKLTGGIKENDIDVLRSGNDIILKTDRKGNEVKMTNWFKGARVETIEFDNGIKWNGNSLNSKFHQIEGKDSGDTITGRASVTNQIDGGLKDDIIYGGSKRDYINGGADNDTLDGKGDVDFYTFNKGFGNDTVIGDGLDIINIQDSFKNLIFNKNGEDLMVNINKSSDSINLKSWFSGSDNKVSEIRLDDKYKITSSKIEQLIQAMATFTTKNGIGWNEALAKKPQEVQAVLTQYFEMDESLA